MNNIAKLIGNRIRYYRTALQLSQEKLAEMAGCHPTYIGQLERGEKNATLESISKISVALNVPLSTMFEKIDDASMQAGSDSSEKNIPLECYDYLLSKSNSEQVELYKILIEIDRYKNIG